MSSDACRWGSLWVANRKTIRTCVTSACVGDKESWGLRKLGSVRPGSPCVILDMEQDELHGVFTLRSKPVVNAKASPFGPPFPFFAPLITPVVDDSIPRATQLLRGILGQAPNARVLNPSQWSEISSLFEGVEADAHTRATNNQGRVRSDNPAQIESDGIHFRSWAEEKFFRALRGLGDFVIMPLPLVTVGDDRIEPDFLVQEGRHQYLFELDGPHHMESPLVADQRVAPLRTCGWIVVRGDARHCNTDTGARACAERMLKQARNEVGSR